MKVQDVGVEITVVQDHGSDQIVRSALRGTVALGLRQGGVLVLNLVGGVALARLLTPTEFGAYAVVLFLKSFLTVAGDAGLGASLIRQVEEPDRLDYRAVFTAQQIVVGLVSLSILAVSPAIASAHDLGVGGLWVLRLVAVSLVFTSLQSIPSIRLERKLAFGPLARAGIAEAIAFNAVAIVLAGAGAGVVSLGIALAVQSFVGAIVLLCASRWPVGWCLDWPRVRRHLSYGLPFQAALVVSLLKDSITPVLIGVLAGARDVGYVRWAQTFGAFAVLAMMLLQRVYLPFFARVQDDRELLRRMVGHTIRVANAVVAPLAVASLVLAPAITRFVFGPQWLPALPIFYLLWLANLFVPTASPAIGVLNALGESRLALGFSIVWMAGTWLFGVPLILAFGAIGFGVANVLVQFTNFLLFRTLNRRIAMNYASLVAPPWVVAGSIGAGAVAAQQVVPVTGLGILLAYAAAMLAMCSVVYWYRWNDEIRAIWAIARN